MPTTDKHRQQYESNKKFLDSISSSYKDWQITAAFYCAVHLVDKILDNKLRIHPKSHNDRILSVERVDPVKFISGDYSVLYVLSRKSRYDCSCISQSDVDNAFQCLNVIENMLIKNT